MGQYERYAHDSQVLAAIGAVLRQTAPAVTATSSPVAVVLPRGLAAAAVDAWQRDETQELAQPEAPWQAAARARAATLALIGLAIESGADLRCDPVTVDMGADLICEAIEAAS